MGRNRRSPGLVTISDMIDRFSEQRRSLAMSDIDRYVEAATRDNTRRSYQSAIRHFEVEWGGFLPASADAIARHFAHHAPSLSVNTLGQRLAAGRMRAPRCATSMRPIRSHGTA
jgi:hypothetical protein